MHAPNAVRFVDSHAHLADPAFDGDRTEVIQRARAAGARAVVCIGESPEAARKAASIASANPGFIWFTAGVHPHTAESFDAARDLDELRILAAEGAVAIGECGLDYHYDNSPRLLQRRAFAMQLELARELRLPVVVHTRDADLDTSAMLREAAAAGVKGVLHCFTGDQPLADAAIESGWYISLSGIVTFARYGGASIIAALPHDRLLVESDAPYLAPVPYRGKRNEPAWVADTLARVASIMNKSTAEAADITARNAAAFFGVALPAV